MTQKAPGEAAVREGVSNLILNCVGVEPGESVLLLNENGGVDRDLVTLMEEAIKSGGGTAYSLSRPGTGRPNEPIGPSPIGL